MTLHLGKGVAMSPNRLQAEALTSSSAQAGTELPPFWELEDLLGKGLDRDKALDVMAARRRRPVLVSFESATWKPSPRRAGGFCEF